jgi:diguanylate cyclase (GGDEF)-like protein
VNQSDALGEQTASAAWCPVPESKGNSCRPDALLEALRDLEQALAGHAEWLKDWHLSTISHIQTDPMTPWEEAEARCPFGRWYKSPNSQLLSTHPAFRDLGQQLEAMHDRAAHLNRLACDQGAIPSTEYALFMNAVIEFNELARHLLSDAWNQLANLDPLTGIGNRQAMLGHLDVERERSGRSGQPCCLVMADIDHFKDINDNMGHTVGDMVLRQVASILANGLRPYDQVFRYGGEEFLICLPNTDLAVAGTVVERLRERIAAAHLPIEGGRVVRATASFGIALLVPDDGVSAAIDRVDGALYAAKKAGRNRVTIWSPT